MLRPCSTTFSYPLRILSSCGSSPSVGGGDIALAKAALGRHPAEILAGTPSRIRAASKGNHRAVRAGHTQYIAYETLSIPRGV